MPRKKRFEAPFAGPLPRRGPGQTPAITTEVGRPLAEVGREMIATGRGVVEMSATFLPLIRELCTRIRDDGVPATPPERVLLLKEVMSVLDMGTRQLRYLADAGDTILRLDEFLSRDPLSPVVGDLTEAQMGDMVIKVVRQLNEYARTCAACGGVLAARATTVDVSQETPAP